MVNVCFDWLIGWINFLIAFLLWHYTSQFDYFEFILMCHAINRSIFIRNEYINQLSAPMMRTCPHLMSNIFASKKKKIEWAKHANEFECFLGGFCHLNWHFHRVLTLTWFEILFWHKIIKFVFFFCAVVCCRWRNPKSQRAKPTREREREYLY